jgi:DNA polymerase III epsilon subunit-like protein
MGFILFDLETTGVNTKVDEIVSIGAIYVQDTPELETQFDAAYKEFCDAKQKEPNASTDNLVVHVAKTSSTKVQWFHRFCKPKREMEEGAVKVTGITSEFLSDKDPFDVVFQSFMKWCQQFPSPVTLWGYNSNRFDIPMLLNNMLRANISLNQCPIKHAYDLYRLIQLHFPEKYKSQLTRHPKTHNPSLSVGSIYKFVTKKPLPDAHDALADCIGTYRVYHYMRHQVFKDQPSEWKDAIHHKRVMVSIPQQYDACSQAYHKASYISRKAIKNVCLQHQLKGIQKLPRHRIIRNPKRKRSPSPEHDSHGPVVSDVTKKRKKKADSTTSQ